MDLELSDEQTWLSESLATLLTREWRPAAEDASGTEAQRARLWASLVDFGALSVGGEEGLGGVELCLVARALGAHLAPVPFLAGAALRFAVKPLAAELPTGFGALADGDDAVALALLEPGSGWTMAAPDTTVAGGVLNGRKAGVEHAAHAGRLGVVASGAHGAALVIVASAAPGVDLTPQPTFDPTAPMDIADFAGVALAEDDVAEGPLAREAIDRLTTVGALLAAAEAVGAAGRLLDDACSYAAERRQFGRTIGSFQALRHLLADMYVRQASSWSSVLYAAAALDEDAGDALRTASIAKAYVSRAAREVAHGAMQVFGGIAVTAEHPAHRFLRRIVVREQQFGDAAHHERALGRGLAATALPSVT
jgi:alkylation response protein AidB-like acyl-CoA dehydrogenase